MSSHSAESLSGDEGGLGFHRGAIDSAMITTKPPSVAMKNVTEVLKGMGVNIEVESEFRYRCVREKKERLSSQDGSNAVAPRQSPPSGNPANDPGDEVVFSVELTRLARLNDTYSVDIRRLKGKLQSYKFLYDTIRDRVKLGP
ncbi:hypothetical protein BDQ12DRAFT_724015 [Crucibulum laeve]|uniref:non-specific serine/threonine protein kinase n=1 Tax=Crucibulum laeve TaxID=68775 RepID=A0A5C3M8V1_9AGAR|nr:hypothetical protein BDQ12DRAFT_724015 [Crucibulum laeve]